MIARELDDIEDLARRFLAVQGARRAASPETPPPTSNGQGVAESELPADTEPINAVNGHASGEVLLPVETQISGQVIALESAKPPAI